MLLNEPKAGGSNVQPNLLEGVVRTSRRFWLMLLPTAAATGVGAGLLMLLLRAVQHTFWSYQSGDFFDAVRAASSERRILVLVLAGVLAGTVRWLIQLQARGNARDIADAIWHHAGRLAPLAAFVQSALSIVIVGLGASLGREAAPKLTGAALANVFASVGRLADAERRLLVACAAGAGMGAVYNVPFGGALFALEALLGTLTLAAAVPALAASLIATCVSWLLIPNEPTYGIPVYSLAFGQVVWAVVAGPLAGLAAVAYVRAIAWVDVRRPKGTRLLFEPVLVFAVLGALAVAFPGLLGNGKDIGERAFADRLGLWPIASLLLLKPLMTVACLGSGAPGGLFTPTLAFGALLGAFLGRGWALLWPGGDAGNYAIVGAGAVFAAAAQAPIAAAVLVMNALEQRSIYSSRIH